MSRTYLINHTQYKKNPNYLSSIKVARTKVIFVFYVSPNPWQHRCRDQQITLKVSACKNLPYSKRHLL